MFDFGDPVSQAVIVPHPAKILRVPGEGSMFPQCSRHIPRSVFPLVQSFSAIHTPTRTFFVAGRQSCRPSSTENSISSRYDHERPTWRVKKKVTCPRLSNSPVCSLRRTRGALENVISGWKLLESERVPAFCHGTHLP